MYRIYFVLMLLVLFAPLQSKATSGACSYHGGVDCSRGRQYDGKVYCNDGWTDSTTYYDYTTKCENTSQCPTYLQEDDYYKFKQEIEDKIKTIQSKTEQSCNYYFNQAEARNEESYQACLNYNNQMEILGARSGRSRYAPEMQEQLYKDCEAEKSTRRQENENEKNLCLYNDDDLIFKYNNLLRCLKLDNRDRCTLKYPNSYTENNLCKCNNGYNWNENQTACIEQPKCGLNSHPTTDNKCACDTGYKWKYPNDDKNFDCTLDQKYLCEINDNSIYTNNQCITKDQNCKNKYGQYSYYDTSSLRLCGCQNGYKWNSGLTQCVVKIEVQSIIKNTSIQEEKNLSTKIDNKLSQKMSGNILLQVEKNGEGWYVNPDDKKKYYLGRPADAFDIMRKLGLGATHDFITNTTTFPDRVLGKILLDVEQNGEAYYINPKDKKAYYLGRPADAFKVMRELGLGISNDDIRKIDVGEVE